MREEHLVGERRLQGGTRPGGPVVSLEGVRKSFGGFVLGPVDLEIEPGQLVTLVGPSGSGKSSLFEILMNVMIPDRGEVRLFGRSYPRDEVAIKQKVGYVPERASGYEEMRPKDLAEFVSYWYPGWDWELYSELTGPIDPESLTKRRFGELSRGVQRRLLFALAASTGAELLLLDEPTSGLDPLARYEMLDDIKRFADGGEERAVLFSTHLLGEVRLLADYVAVLVDGELRGPYEKNELLGSWMTLWVDREPEAGTPGVVGVETGSPVCLVTSSREETERALRAQGVTVYRHGAPALEEILSRMMRRTAAGSRA